MAKIGTVVIEIDANTAKLVKGVKESNKRIGNLEKSVNRAKKSIADFAKYAVGIYAVGKAFSFVTEQASSFVSTSAQFEQFETTLTSITGSSKAAEESMSWIQDFAKTTPYELAQVTEAFVKMKAYGLDPMDGSLTALGNASSAMGKDVVQAVEAMADAVTGENERLKEFGIKASKSGDTIAYAWSDSSGKSRKIVIKNNKDIIQSTLTAIFNEKYIGAMDAQSKTWNGMISNMSDSWTNFQKSVMDEGLFDYLKGVLGVAGDMLKGMFSDGAVGAKEWTKTIISGIKSTIGAIGVLKDTWSGLSAVFGVVKTAFWQMVGAFGTGMNTIQKAWNSLNNAMSQMWADMANGVKSVFEKMINWIIDKINGISTSVNSAAGIVGIDSVFGKLEHVSFEKTTAELVKLGEPISNVETAWKYAKDAQEEYIKDFKDFAEGSGQKQAADAIEAINKKVDENTSATKDNSKAKKDAQKILNDMIKNSLKASNTESKKSKAASKASKDRAKLLKKEAKAAKDAEAAMQEYGERFADDFASAFEGILGGDVFSAFESFFNNIGTTLVKPFIDDISKSMSGMLSGMLSGLGHFGSAIVGVGIGLITNIVGGLLTSGKVWTPEEWKTDHNVITDVESKSVENLLKGMNSTLLDQLKYSKGMFENLKIMVKQTGKAAVSLSSSFGFKSKDAYTPGALGGIWGGTDMKTLFTGLEMSFSALNGAIAYNKEVLQKTKTSWFGLSKKTTVSTSLTPVEQETIDAINAAYKSGMDAILNASSALGIAGADAIINGFVGQVKDLDFEGKTQEEIQAMIGGAISADLDAMVRQISPSISEFQKVGEGLMETFGRLAVEVETTDYIFSKIGVSMEQLGGSVLDISDAFIEASGGLDAAASNMKTYMDNYYSDSEKFTSSMRDLNKQFSQMGIAVPDSKEAFRSLVETTTDPKMLASLLAISGAFAQVMDEADRLQESLQDEAKANAEHLAQLREDARQAAREFSASVISRDAKEVTDAYKKKLDAEKAYIESSVKFYENMLSRIESAYTGSLSYLNSMEKASYLEQLAAQKIGTGDTQGYFDALSKQLEYEKKTSTNKEDYALKFERYIYQLQNTEPETTLTDVNGTLEEILKQNKKLETAISKSSYQKAF